MSKFKVGDLALTLVGIPGHIEVGACVEVRRVLEIGDEYLMRDGLKIADKRKVMVSRDASNYLYNPDELMPLRGDFQPEQQKAKEVEV